MGLLRNQAYGFFVAEVNTLTIFAAINCDAIRDNDNVVLLNKRGVCEERATISYDTNIWHLFNADDKRIERLISAHNVKFLFIEYLGQHIGDIMSLRFGHTSAIV